eukprot:TRINITY_DN16523_c0_g1_i1.p1 TRINITY_DN16523_c0_g1~~TRINITY_DN16523_c0_g1_i1.p1  ORF type:complete len:548 (+),score=175.19 TRINITY_DN16523_c0_g1_i1:82-1725(+)
MAGGGDAVQAAAAAGQDQSPCAVETSAPQQRTPQVVAEERDGHGKVASTCCVHPDHAHRHHPKKPNPFSKGFASAISAGGAPAAAGSGDAASEASDEAAAKPADPDEADGDLIPEQDLIDQLEIPTDCSETDGQCSLIQLRIFRMDRVALHKLTNCRMLVLRQNLIHEIHPLPPNLEELDELELYDNKIRVLQNLDNLRCLRVLDLSYNNIRIIENLDCLAGSLEVLFLTENKITKIQGLEKLTKLRQLELGSNRIREVVGISTLTNLEDLWLGKNKITQLAGLQGLTKLRRLSLQANRLTEIPAGSLQDNTALTDLHLSENRIPRIQHVGHLRQLRLLDFCFNPIQRLDDIAHLSLTELWITDARVADWKEVEKLRGMESLRTLYLERNPVEDARYRHRLAMLLPQLVEIDSWPVVRRDLTGQPDDGQDPRGLWVDGEDAELTFKASRGDANPVRPLTDADRERIAAAAELRRQKREARNQEKEKEKAAAQGGGGAAARGGYSGSPAEPLQPLWGDANGAAGCGVAVFAAAAAAAAAAVSIKEDVD